MNRRDFIKASALGIAAVCAGSSKNANAAGMFSSVEALKEQGEFSKITDDLWVFRDTCNVYVVKQGDSGIAIDFGSGKWLKNLDKIGVKQLDHVFLTHHHADQCSGLSEKEDWPFVIHAPAGEERFLNPEFRKKIITKLDSRVSCPSSYCVPPSGIKGISYDIQHARDIFWQKKRIQFVSTPGHSSDAYSIVIEAGNKQVVFCGDAAYEGGKIWQPFHLEWNHYTPDGILMAWRGVKRLSNLYMDLLCPSHGPVIVDKPIEKLKILADRLMDFYDSKIYVSPNEKDNCVEPQKIITYQINGKDVSVYKISEHLYQFGSNGYLLLSSTGKALIVDMFNDMEVLEQLLTNELPAVKPDAAFVSHYHRDHSEGAVYLRKKYGIKLYLHPRVQEPLADVNAVSLPWLPGESIIADELWPEKGGWRWNEYEFKVTPWAGQTWWHCGFMTTIDGQKVFFSGDNFFPNSRWEGTGGYCAFNGSRFSEGYVPTAELILEWKPEIVAAGHGNFYYFSPSKFQKIKKWAQNTEKVISKLCATGDIQKEYYSMGLKPKDFISHMPKLNPSYAWI